ncbi:unnamed protein product [Paramecium primaurelia]|uniref:Transmembrane protein n=1 Tax=Paramecium primaurelia TaxID=5886 RepID=A0A8S1JTC6_PARPR|nr:unnamed protein product [Paramecium primaurelia]
MQVCNKLPIVFIQECLQLVSVILIKSICFITLLAIVQLVQIIHFIKNTSNIQQYNNSNFKIRNSNINIQLYAIL